MSTDRLQDPRAPVNEGAFIEMGIYKEEFQLGGARRRMSWRQFILALELHTSEEMETAGFGLYWVESDPMQRDNWTLATSRPLSVGRLFEEFVQGEPTGCDDIRGWQPNCDGAPEAAEGCSIAVMRGASAVPALCRHLSRTTLRQTSRTHGSEMISQAWGQVPSMQTFRSRIEGVPRSRTAVLALQS
ncbi:hypothetical protein Tco_0875758 [Tanacetum coccineum]|uniref:Uncharacterized protein n=1 Tax=Tanacetum coccineum TaxID=301880 RepID=A0ABQ5BT95_9ASTR